jgi:hypothetical protein
MPFFEPLSLTAINFEVDLLAYARPAPVLDPPRHQD